MNKQHKHQKIPVGVSSCLLGFKVRYDGGHKAMTQIKKLSQDFELLAFCPEAASGMGSPRQPIQLRRIDSCVRCVRVDDFNTDVTEQLLVTAARQQQWLEKVCGYILKKDSPSCGVAGVEVFNHICSERSGTGLFAQYLKNHFPGLPMIEEDAFKNPKSRVKFIQQVKDYAALKDFAHEMQTAK